MKTNKVLIYEFDCESMVRVDRVSRLFVDDDMIYFYVLGSTVKHQHCGKTPAGAHAHYRNIMRLLNGEGV